MPFKLRSYRRLLLFEFMFEFMFPLLLPFEFLFPFLFLFLLPLFEFMLLELPFDMLPFDMLSLLMFPLLVLPVDMMLLFVVVVVLLELPLEFLFPQFFANTESASRSSTAMPCLIEFSPVVEDYITAKLWGNETQTISATAMKVCTNTNETGFNFAFIPRCRERI